MKKLFALFATATMIFAAGCGDNMDDVNPDKPNQGQEQPNNPEPDLPYDTLHLSANNEDSQVQHIWNNNDQISVFNKTDGNECWKFKENANNQGTFYKISGIPGTKTNKVIALYPYDPDCTIKGNMINTDFPTVQTHEDNYYNEFGATVLMAVSNDDNLQFQNISCWIELGLTDDIERRSVKQIVLRGNNNEILAGNIDIDINSQKIYRKDNSGSCITFNCKNKVQLSNIPKYFYIAVVPQSFIKGISVTVIMDDGTSFEKSFEDSFTITCNQRKTFNASGFRQDNNTISYTTTSGGAIKLTTTDGFGANFVSHTYKNGLGVIQFDGNITSIPEIPFESIRYLTSITIPDSVTSIGRGAFSDCESLTSINIPDNVTSIGSYAFSGCKSLTSINIPDNVTSIGSYAFSGCKSLTSINIPDSVTTIEPGTFQYCSRLTSINIPDSVTSIGDGAFYNCSRLKSINIPDSVTSIGSGAFYNCSIANVYITDITKWCAIQFKDISSNPLYENYSWANVHSHNLIINGELLGTDLVIPDNVSSIGNYAFCNCGYIKSITIGSNVAYIGTGNFYDYSRDSDITIYCKPITPPELYASFRQHVYSSKTNGIVYVPIESVELYEKSKWGSSWYSFSIFGYSF